MYAYVMQAASGPVKIGIAVSPEQRRQFVDRWHRWDVEGEISVRHAVEIPGDLSARKVEHVAHVLAGDKRLRGEWFDLTPDEALGVIERAVELRGVSPAGSRHRVAVDMPADLKERIRRYRFANEIDTESEAIRQLIERGLEAGENSNKKRPSK